MGTPRKNSFHYDVYPQSVSDAFSGSGVLTLNLTYSWYDITLTENITSILTTSDPASDRAFSFSILVTQSASTVYTINWLASGKFYSPYNAGELQPPTTLGAAARYTCIWDGTRYRVYIDSELTLPSTAFMLELTTTVIATSITMPFVNTGVYNCTIDWGDGTITSVTSYNDSGATHEYAAIGAYTASIEGPIGRFSTLGGSTINSYITKFISFGTGVLSTITGMNMSNCSNLTSIPIKFDLPGDTGNLFTFNYGLITADISAYNVSSILACRTFLADAANLTTLNCANLNFSSATEISRFISGTSVVTLDASTWTTSSSLTNLGSFAEYAGDLVTLNVTGWNVTGLIDLSYFASYASSLTSIPGINGWTTTNLQNVNYAFDQAVSLDIDVSSWDASKLVALTNTFTGVSDVTPFTNVSNLMLSMSSSFKDADVATLDLSGWDVSEVITMNNMMSGCTFLTSLDVSTWTISECTNITGILFDAPIVVADFDALLVGWTGWTTGAATKSVKSGLTLTANATSFTPASDAADAANWLVTTKGWNIITGP